MTILYVVVAFLVGWFIGFLDSNLRTAQKIKAAEQRSEAAIKDVEIKIAQSQQKFQSQQDDPGLLRLKKDNGRIKLEVDGALVGDILTPDRKKRLIELVTFLRPWLEGGQPQSSASSLVTPIPSQPAPDPAQSVIYSPAPSSAQPLTPVAKKPEAEKNIAALSIVGQIDVVLQARLAGTALEKKGIRIQDSPQGEVEVYVGPDKFHSVDDVPDETVKAIIRSAIAEWEDKFTPGLKKT